MQPAQLKRESMFPVYGLAEASLAVTFPSPGAPLHTCQLDRHHLTVGEPAQELEPGSREAVELVSVGRPLPNSKVRICADDDRVLPEGTVGHILISGDNVTGDISKTPPPMRPATARMAGCAPGTSG